MLKVARRSAERFQRPSGAQSSSDPLARIARSAEDVEQLLKADLECFPQPVGTLMGIGIGHALQASLDPEDRRSRMFPAIVTYFNEMHVDGDVGPVYLTD